MVKLSAFAFVGIFLVAVFAVGFAAATTSSDFSISNIDYDSGVSEDAGDFDFTFDLTYTGASSSMDVSFGDSATSPFGAVSIPTQTGLDGTLVGGDTVTVTGTVSSFANQGGNTMNIVINATDTGSERDDSNNFNVNIIEIENFCSNGNQGDLRIEDFNVENLGSGSDEEWEPLDEIEIEVEIENINNDDDVKDVLVEIKIEDNNGNDVTNDFDLDDEEVDLGKIKEDDSELAIFKISEVPADIDEGKYRIYVKAYSEDDEDTECIAESNDLSEDLYHEVEFTREDDQAVIVKNEDLSQDLVATCGDQDVPVSFPIYNIGTDKEEAVLVNVYNGALGVDEDVVVDNLRSGKKKEVTLFIDIPEELDREDYKLKVFTYFEYDDDEDKDSEFSYDSNSFDDLDKDYVINLEILGCKGPAPGINAALDSAAKVGEDLVVKAAVKNNGAEEEFVISVSGYEAWAELVGVTPQTASLGQDQSVEVVVTLRPTDSGFKTFSIDTIASGESYSQPVSVNIAEEPGLFEGITNETLYYIIGAIVVVLILILIVVIVRLAKRPTGASEY